MRTPAARVGLAALREWVVPMRYFLLIVNAGPGGLISEGVAYALEDSWNGLPVRY